MKAKILEVTDKPSVNISLDTVKIGKQALVFVNSKKAAEKTAEDIAKKRKFETKEERIIEIKLKEIAERAKSVLLRPTKQCLRLSYCILKGVAFHHAGLASEQRELIEDNFKSAFIKVICSTPTLAAGVDIPAYRAIIRDVKRFSGAWGSSYIPVLEYMQMAGRAGRPKYDTVGEAILIANTESDKDMLNENYILGEPEEIFSKLAVEPVLRTYLLSLIATEFVRTDQEIYKFFEKTFWAYQYGDMEKLNFEIEKIIQLLKNWEFIKSTEDDFVTAGEYGNSRYFATTVGKRVAELYLDPLTANFIITCLLRAKDKTIKDFSFLQIISATLEIRPTLKVKQKDYEEINEKIVDVQDCILQLEPSMFDHEYEDFLNSIKTAFFLQDWVEEKDEEYLLEKYEVRPGEIRAKLAICDWLLYSTEEICRILNHRQLLKSVSKIRFRLKHGAKEELIPLLRLKDIGRVRARKLFSNGIRDLGDIKNIEITSLVQIIGRNTAINIKQQVGQDFSKLKVKEGKRKGQISLLDYSEGR